MTYDAVVLDVVSNDGTPAGTTVRSNSASLTFAGDPDGPENVGSVDVSIVEPELVLSKSASANNGFPADAGDTVTFELVLDNTAGTSTAFDVELRDAVDSTKFSSVTEVATPTGFNFDFNGAVANTVVYTSDPGVGVAPGSSVTFRFSAVLTGAVEAGETLINTVQLQGASTLPGNDANERSVTTPNANANVPIAAPSVSKTLVSSEIENVTNARDEGVIGEKLTYRLQITVPEGVTENMQILDTLDSGLAYVGITSIARSSAALTTTIGANDFSDLPATFENTAGVGAQGSSVPFVLGDVTNSNTNNATAETITIEYEVLVLNVAGNQEPGTALNNSARLTASNGVDTTAAAPTVAVIEPNLQVPKSVVVGGAGTEGDAGDTVAYTIQIQHANAQSPDAFDVSLSDPIPAFVLAPTIASVTANGIVAPSFEIAGSTLQVQGGGNFDLPSGASVTIVVNGTVAPNVTPGQTIVNQADIDWSSLDGGVNNLSPFVNDGSDSERDGSAPGGLNNYAANDSATIQISAVTPEKSIAATSEAHTGAAGGTERISIGEVVRYRLITLIPETQINDLQIRENLPDGFIFLNDGTARAAFVGDMGGISSTDPAASGAEDWSLTAPAAFINGSQANIAGIGLTAQGLVLDDDNVSSDANTNVDTYNSGSDIFFRFGDVVNADNDANNEYLIVEFNAVLANEAGNSAGTMRSNDFTVRSGGADIGTSNALEVGVAEPDVQLAKSLLNTPPVDAGDSVQYRLVLSNAATGNDAAAAFDLNLRDDFDALMPAGSITVTNVAIDAGSAPGVVTTNNSAGSVIDIDVDQLDPGESITVTVTGRVNDTIAAGTDLINTAAANGTSLPGTGTSGNPTGSDTPGAAGSGTGERTGTDGPGGTPNNYAATSTVNQSIPAPTQDKLLADTDTTYSIGETVSYDIVVVVPEGTTNGLSLVDDIPAGLQFSSAQIITDGTTFGATSSRHLSASFGGETPTIASTVGGGASGADVTLTLDPVRNFNAGTTTTDNNSTNNTFVVRVEAIVLDIAANEGNTTGQVTNLTNSLSATFTDPEGGATAVTDPNPGNDPMVDLVEPRLTVAKSVNGDPNSVSLDAGDAVTYQMLIAHDNAQSTSTAFEVSFSDNLPSTISSPDNNAFTGADIGAGLAITAVHSTLGDISNQFELVGTELRTRATADIDLALTETITITVTGLLNTTARAGELIDNTSNIDYSSADGNVPGERDQTSPNGGDYSDSDDADINIAAPTHDKRLAETQTDYTIEETVSYDIVFEVPEGVTNALTIVDDIPTGLQFANAQIITDGTAFGATSSRHLSANFGGETPVIATTVGGGGSGTDVTFTLDPVRNFSAGTNTADNNAANNQFVLRVEATVLDIPANVGTTTGQVINLTNSVNTTFDDPESGATTATDPTPGNNPMIDLVEPRLTIDKTSPVTRADVGDVASFSLTVRHTSESTSAAFDIVIEDNLLNQVNGTTPGTNDDYTIQTGSVRVLQGATDLTATTVITGNTGGDTSIRVEIAGPFEPTDDPITISYDALLNANLGALGDQARNQANLTYDGLQGPGGRSVTANDTHDIDIPLDTTTPTIDKSVVSTSLDHTGTGAGDPNNADVVAGEVVTYQLVVTLDEGTYRANGNVADADIRITDTLPAFLELAAVPTIADVSIGADVRMENTFGTQGFTFTGAVGGNSLSIDGNIDEIELGPDFLTGNDLSRNQITVNVQARVTAGAVPTTSLTNTSSLFFLETSDTVAIDTDSESIDVVGQRLTIAKSVNDDTPNLGDTITYTVVVAHDTDGAAPDSTMDAFDLRIEDLLNDANLSLVPGTVQAAPATAGDTDNLQIVSGAAAGDTTVVVSADRLALGGRINISFDATVTNDPAAFLANATPTNTVSVSSDNIPGTDANEVRATETDMQTVTIVNPDLVVTKTDGGATTTAGGQVSYTIEVTNKAGATADTATNISVVDTLPTGATFNAGLSTAGATVNATAGTATWTIANLAPGASQSFTVVVDVANPVPAALEALQNQVAVSHDDIEPTPNDNSATETTPIDAAPVLAISKDDGLTDLQPGQSTTYTISVSNTGDQHSRNVVVSDTYPTNVLGNLVASDGGVVDINAGTITWNFAQLDAGQTLTLTVTATIKASIPAAITNYTNTVTVSDDGAGTGGMPLTDTDTDVNNLIAVPDYVIEKSHDLTVASPGDAFSYSLTVRNVGNQDGTGVVVTDNFPSALLTIVSTSNGGVVDQAGGTITWNLPVLRSGESLNLTVDATIPNPVPAGSNEIANTAGIRDDGMNGFDPTPQNNSSSARTELRVFVYDGVRSDLPEGFDDDPYHNYLEERPRYRMPLPLPPLYSGSIEPGTTLSMRLFDSGGSELASRSVVADAGGNWVVIFPTAYITDFPHSMTIEQFSSPASSADVGAFNWRTYFAPALHHPVFLSAAPDVNGVFAYSAANILTAFSGGVENPVSLGNSDAHVYEYLVSSSTTTHYAN